MVKWLFLTLIVLPAMMIGCSGGPQHCTEPMTPSPVESPELREPVGDDISQRALLGLWQIWFDPDTQNIEITPLREAQPHYNITNLLTPPICNNCLQVSLNYFDPVSRIFDVDVSLRNPYSVSGRDVRGILYTNEAGHRLMNADGWTNLYDIPGGDTINPFKAFAKDQPKRIFGGLKAYTENFSIYLPTPPQFQAITYAADGCWMGSCREPYALDNFEQSTMLGDSIGSQAIIEVDVYDWQNDISGVYIASPEITGEDLVPFEHLAGNRWRGVLENNQGIPDGYHQVRIAATSPNPVNAYLYNFFTIQVIPKVPSPISIDPDNTPASSELIDAIVTGEDFQGPGASVILLRTGAPDIEAANVVVVDGETITCDFSVPFTAPWGMYDVRVVNGNGYGHTTDDVFEVTSPLPVVTDIDPDITPIETDLPNVTITGNDFIVPGVLVKLKLDGQPDVSATNVVVADPNTITCDISISCAEIAGMYDLEVTNNGGKSSILSQAFEVYCPIVNVGAIIPETCDVGTDLAGVIITGNNFICDAANVTLKKDGAPDLVATNIVIVDSTTLTCDIPLPLDTIPGLYNVEVTNLCGETGVGTGLFDVVCLPPTILGLSVPATNAGTTVTGIVITGTRIKGPSALVKFKKTGAPDIDASNIQVVDSTTINCDITIPIDAPIGIYNVEVTNGCGTLGTGIGLFEVICPTPIITSIDPDKWASYPYAPLNSAVITGEKFMAGGGPSSIYLDNGSVQIYANNIVLINNSIITCGFSFGSYPWEEDTYDLVVVTSESGTGANLFTTYDNLLFSQDFADGDGGCSGTGTHGGYCYTGEYWDTYSPAGEPYPISMYSAFMTPEFDVPAVALDVHFQMVHSIDTDILEGAIAGWTNNDGITFFGDRCDSTDRWYWEMWQNYNGDDFFSPVFEGMGIHIDCFDPVGWSNRYWLGHFGDVGGSVLSKFHCTSTANLIGMSNARFMVVFLSDAYVESKRGQEISELIIWYDPPS